MRGRGLPDMSARTVATAAPSRGAIRVTAPVRRPVYSSARGRDDECVGESVAVPTRGEVFPDDRGMARALRVTWHPEVQLMVLSLWQGERCTGTFRLPAADIPAFVQALIAAPLGAPATAGVDADARTDTAAAINVP